MLDNEPFNIQTFKKKWLGIKERTHTLLEVFKEHNEQLFALIGKDCSKATYGKYRTTYDHTAAFIQWKYGLKDSEISKLTYAFITDYEFYLKSKQKCNHNTTIKYLSNLRKVVNICLKNGWLAKDPFFGFKMSKKEVIRDILREDEIQTLISKDFKNERLNQVRDIFVFSCFTGLAYVDAKRLKRSGISVGIDGENGFLPKERKRIPQHAFLCCQQYFIL